MHDRSGLCRHVFVHMQVSKNPKSSIDMQMHRVSICGVHYDLRPTTYASTAIRLLLKGSTLAAAATDRTRPVTTRRVASATKSVMTGPSTPQGATTSLIRAKTWEDIVQLGKADLTVACREKGINVKSGSNQSQMMILLIKKLQEENSCNIPGGTSTVGQTTDVPSVMQQLLVEFKQMREDTASVLAQVAALSIGYADTRAENEKLSAKVSALDAELKALRSEQCTTTQSPSVDTVQTAVEVAVREAAEIERRKLNLRITRLPAGIDSQEDATELVNELQNALGVNWAVQTTRVTLLKPSYSAVAASNTPASNKTGSILFSVGSVQEELEILKARRKLQDSDKFRAVGVNEDLTKKQQAEKSAAWPDFKAARAAGKRASFHGSRLFINGEAFKSSPATPE